MEMEWFNTAISWVSYHAPIIAFIEFVGLVIGILIGIWEVIRFKNLKRQYEAQREDTRRVQKTLDTVLRLVRHIAGKSKREQQAIVDAASVASGNPKVTIIQDIEEILSLVEKIEKNNRDYVSRSRLQILLNRFNELGLQPPAKQIPITLHFGWLLPLVQEYGVEKAKREMINWYLKAVEKELARRGRNSPLDDSSL